MRVFRWRMIGSNIWVTGLPLLHAIWLQPERQHYVEWYQDKQKAFEARIRRAATVFDPYSEGPVLNENGEEITLNHKVGLTNPLPSNPSVFCV